MTNVLPCMRQRALFGAPQKPSEIEPSSKAVGVTVQTDVPVQVSKNHLPLFFELKTTSIRRFDKRSLLGCDLYKAPAIFQKIYFYHTFYASSILV